MADTLIAIGFVTAFCIGILFCTVWALMHAVDGMELDPDAREQFNETH